MLFSSCMKQFKFFLLKHVIFKYVKQTEKHWNFNSIFERVSSRAPLFGTQDNFCVQLRNLIALDMTPCCITTKNNNNFVSFRVEIILIEIVKNVLGPHILSPKYFLRTLCCLSKSHTVSNLFWDTQWTFHWELSKLFLLWGVMHGTLRTRCP